MTRKLNFDRELQEISAVVVKFQKRIKFIEKQGVNVDQINAALSALGTDVDALIAKPGGITPVQAQTITDGINAIGAKVKAALTS